jgi:hypothetical protein
LDLNQAGFFSGKHDETTMDFHLFGKLYDIIDPGTRSSGLAGISWSSGDWHGASEF